MHSYRGIYVEAKYGAALLSSVEIHDTGSISPLLPSTTKNPSV